MEKRYVGIAIVSTFFILTLQAQSPIHHWETAIFADDIWQYRLGDSEPSNEWIQSTFDDGNWESGQGGFGYDDGDDNTIVPATNSIYLRKDFEITDLSKIEMAVLHADYDDAFVAYLNGIEIGRANIGATGDHPTFDEPAITWHEAQMYNGGLPDEFPVSKNQINSILQEGTNTLAIQVHNSGIGSSDLSSIFFLSFGINDESTFFESVPVWFYEPFASSDLPLLFITTNGQEIVNEPRIEAHLGIIDNGPGNRNNFGDPFNDYDGKIAIEIRGASSQSFPKKNYGFETWDEAGEDQNVSLLGMPSENDWILHGPYSDKSLMRNALTYHFGNQMGNYAPRTRYCELLINNQYRGVYMLTERIKRDQNRVDIANLKPEDIEGDELTGGYILQIDRDDPNIDNGWYASISPFVFYAYDDPDWDELMPEQKNYIKGFIQDFEQAMNGANFYNLYNLYIDVPSFIDYVIATEVAKHIDAYKLSFFMYKKKDSNGGKLHLGPLWDINLGYGNFDFGCDEGPEDWSWTWVGNCAAQPFWLSKLMSLTSIRNEVNCRWQDLRTTALHIDTLLNYIDNKALELDEAQERNFDRWQTLGNYVWPNAFVGNTYEEEVNYTKDWLEQRLNWMDENMVGTCIINASNDIAKNMVEIKAFPNPFSSEINFTIFNNNTPNGALRITDVLGKVIAEIEVNFSNKIQWNGENLTKGIYFYQLIEKHEVVATGKLIKE